ncbi:MAG: type 1 glutamine amidotransferase [Rhodobacteraceae bacterium]|nr:type 1 glutamine amidotransferase [Paracoccaceae bacterium]MCY4195581.1 type 1 glutamine amidotransferase [Paracoccaceae bacterium]MCY4326164.1 type 1 glutamine amidotransferase [Paracoccaceae bacterium]
MTFKIGILQADHLTGSLAEKYTDYAHLFRQILAGYGFRFQTWPVVDSEFPDSPADSDGWLVTGSRFSVCDSHSWIRQLEDFVRRCINDKSPVVGICFGHQILATALGGRVAPAAGGWCVGRQCYETGDGPIFLNAWHQDQISQLPPDAEVTGRSESCPYAMLSYGDSALSFQAHPEFSDAFLGDLIRERKNGGIDHALLSAARASLDQKSSSRAVATQIATFFQTAQRVSPSLSSPQASSSSTF